MHANIDILNSLVVYTTIDTYVPVQLKSSQQSVSLKEKQGEVFETGHYFIYQTKVASMYFWLVSLVYQLSGQSLICLVDQNKIWSTKKYFGIAKENYGIPKRNLVNQKKIWLTKKIFVVSKKLV